MNLLLSSAAVGLALAVGGAYADTSTTKDKATMERKASPSAPKSDEERAEASQGQPNTPHPQGSSAPSSKKKSAKAKPSSSAGSSAPTALSSEKEQAFKGLDIDGDGGISKAEAAGHAMVVTGFDRADADRDGKLSRGEYDKLGQPAVKGKRKARAKTAMSQ